MSNHCELAKELKAIKDRLTLCEETGSYMAWKIAVKELQETVCKSWDLVNDLADAQEILLREARIAVVADESPEEIQKRSARGEKCIAHTKNRTFWKYDSSSKRGTSVEDQLSIKNIPLLNAQVQEIRARMHDQHDLLRTLFASLGIVQIDLNGYGIENQREELKKKGYSFLTHSDEAEFWKKDHESCDELENDD